MLLRPPISTHPFDSWPYSKPRPQVTICVPESSSSKGGFHVRRPKKGKKSMSCIFHAKGRKDRRSGVSVYRRSSLLFFFSQ